MNIKTKNRSLLGSTFILGGGLVVAKLIGAMYRIPLAGLLGCEGLGVYQMVFPLYSLLLTLSSSAIPTSLAKVISENLATGRGEDAVVVYRMARKVILAVSAVCFVLLFFFGKQVARLQGGAIGGLSYVAISPSILLVGFVACFRGKFQGMNNMLPTALSQICEQVGKLVFSIVLPVVFGNTLEEKVALAVFGVTASEMCGLAFLMIYSLLAKKSGGLKNEFAAVWYRGEKACNADKKLNKRKEESFKKREKKAVKGFDLKQKINSDRKVQILSPLFKIALPMTISLSVYPIAGIMESGIIINFINMASGNGVEQFGIYSGVIVTLVSLPLGVCSALGTALVPSISADIAKGRAVIARRKISFAIKAGMAVSLAVSMLFLFFSQQIVSLLFSRIAGTSGGLCGKMLKWSFVNVMLACFSNITSAILYALSESSVPLKSQLWGLGVRFLVLCGGISFVGIYASLAGVFAGGVVSGVLNFRGINNALQSPLSARPLLTGGLAMTILGLALAAAAKHFEISIMWLICIAAIYLAFVFMLFFIGFFTKEEVESFALSE